jgi:hypothetical protein
MSDLQAIADRVEIDALRGEFTDVAMMRDRARRKATRLRRKENGDDRSPPLPPTPESTVPAPWIGRHRSGTTRALRPTKPRPAQEAP